MVIHEYQAKALFREMGIEVPAARWPRSRAMRNALPSVSESPWL